MKTGGIRKPVGIFNIVFTVLIIQKLIVHTIFGPWNTTHCFKSPFLIRKLIYKKVKIWNFDIFRVTCNLQIRVGPILQISKIYFVKI